jgi:hypothetical protein
MITVPFYSVRSALSAEKTGKYLEFRCDAANPPYPDSRDAVIFPPAKPVRIKQVTQTVGRTAVVTLKGIPRKAVRPGAVIVPELYDACMTGTAYGVLRRERGGSVAAAGITGSARLETLDFPLLPGVRDAAVSVQLQKHGMKLVFKRPVLLCPGAAYRVVLPETENSGLVFVPVIVETLASKDEPVALSILSRLSRSIEHEDILEARAQILGYTHVPPALREKVMHRLGADGFMRSGEFVVSKEYLDALCGKLIAKVRHAQEPTAANLLELLGVHRDILKTAADGLIERGMLSREEDGTFSLSAGASVSDGSDLSPAARTLKNELERLGTAGLDLTASETRKHRPVAAELVRKGHAVYLTSSLVYHSSVYRRCVETLIAGKVPGEPLTIQEAKNRLGLSRRFILPLVDRMVRDRSLERNDGILSIPRPRNERKNAKVRVVRKKAIGTGLPKTHGGSHGTRKAEQTPFETRRRSGRTRIVRKRRDTGSSGGSNDA